MSAALRTRPGYAPSTVRYSMGAMANKPRPATYAHNERHTRCAAMDVAKDECMDI